MVPTFLSVKSKSWHYKINIITYHLFFSYIFAYATASTQDAAYIIGGADILHFITQFKDNQWSRFGKLNRSRYVCGSLTVGDKTIIIGGHVEYHAT